jgi:hypothetical protein
LSTDVLVVDEELFAAVVGGDETPPLFGIEELHGAGRHAETLSLIMPGHG